MAPDSHLLEINLISAQDLKKPPSSRSAAAAILRRLQAYAVVWVDPSVKLRTSVDRDGGENPTWNDKFLFRVPAEFLSGESSSAVHIEIYAVGYLVNSLIGTVHFLVGNQQLLSSAPGVPFFAAVGIRRASGRFDGVLNLATMILPRRHLSALAGEALSRTGATAIAYRDLMAENSKIWRRRSLQPPSPARKDSPRVLKEWNRGDDAVKNEPEVGKIDGMEDGAGLCGLGVGFHRKIHLSPSDQNLRLSMDPKRESTAD